jgi:hypothetical protein
MPSIYAGRMRADGIKSGNQWSHFVVLSEGPDFSGPVKLGCQLTELFSKYPEAAIQSYRLVNAVNLARRRALRAAVGVELAAGQTATDYIFLDDVESRPEVGGGVCAATRADQLIGGKAAIVRLIETQGQQFSLRWRQLVKVVHHLPF